MAFRDAESVVGDLREGLLTPELECARCREVPSRTEAPTYYELTQSEVECLETESVPRALEDDTVYLRPS